MSLVLVHTRRQLVETLRTPVMFLSVVLIPVAVLLFFIVPFIGQDAVAMTGATGTVMVFAVLLACVGHFSTVVAAVRESPWGSYLRTLPGGLAPQALSHLAVGLVVVTAAVVPVIAVAGLFTAATATVGAIALAFLALLVAVVVFTLMGLALGYLLSLRSAVIVNSVIFLPLGVGGGMFFDPADTPALVETIAPFFPTRGPTDLVLAALTDYAPSPLALVMLALWTVAFAVLAVWGYRRDEGRRFA